MGSAPVINLPDKESILYSTVLIVFVAFLRFLISIKRRNSKHLAMLELASATRRQRDEKMEIYFSKVVSEVSKERQLKIVGMSAKEIVDEIRGGRLKCREAFIAFSLRACTIGKELNLIADCDFENSLKLADEADLKYENCQDKTTLPPLFGLPISIKDQILVKGLRSTYGMIKFRDNVVKENSYLTEILIQQGAIPLCKSNVPQGLLALESLNNIYGNSLNPWNSTKTAGGSSGGEAGLVSAFCSPLGIGSDIGGSIRNPANYCGIYGFKPTSTRFSKSKILQMDGNYDSGFKEVMSSYGSLSRSIDDLVLCNSSIFGNFPLDYAACPTKFNMETYDNLGKTQRKLKIAYNYSISRCEVAPGIIKEIDNVLNILKTEGHTIVNFDLEKHLEIIDKGAEIMLNSQKFNLLFENLDGEAPLYSYTNVKTIIDFPEPIVKLSSFITRLMNEKRKSELINKVHIYKSVREYIDNVLLFDKLKKQFINEFRDNEFDCIILPVQPFPALDLGLGNVSPIMIFYTMLMNYLDMPAGSVPLNLLQDNTYVSKHKDNIKKQIELSIETSKNLPVGLQVACLPYQDELCLSIMKKFDSFNHVKHEKSQNVLKPLLNKITDRYGLIQI